MMNTNRLETKIWTAITAICSSILTSLLSDLISTTSYVVLEKDSKLIVQSTSPSLFDLILNYLKLLGIFFVIWLLLNVLIFTITRIYKKIHVRKIAIINEKELSSILDTVKQRSMTLYERFLDNNSADIRNCFIKMNMKELSSIILQLYDYFSRPDVRGKNNIKKMCRNYASSSFVSITDGISCYELEGTFMLLQIMIEEAKSIQTSDELLKKDCTDMEALLNEIKLIFSMDEMQN